VVSVVPEVILHVPHTGLAGSVVVSQTMVLGQSVATSVAVHGIVVQIPVAVLQVSVTTEQSVLPVRHSDA